MAEPDNPQLIPELERLRARVAELEQAASEHQHTENLLRQRTHELAERVKELSCLYRVSQLIDQPAISLETLLPQIVNLLPAAWQYPEVTCARIRFQNQEFGTATFEITPWKQAQTIRAGQKVVGTIEVYYREEKAPAALGPFLKEEETLINAVAERLGKTIERIQAEAELQRLHQQLETLVAERTAELATVNEQLHRSEANLTALIENTDDIIVYRDRDGRAIVYNRSFATIVQKMFKVDAYPGIRTINYLSEPKRIHWETIIEKSLSGENYSEEFTWDFGNETRYYDLVFNPIRAGNEIIGIAEFTRDITERKLAEQKLRDSEARLRGIVTASPDIIFLFDETGHYLEILTSSSHLLYRNADQLQGKTITEVIPSPLNQVMMETIQQTIATGLTQTLEYRLDIFSDRPWFEARTAPMDLMLDGPQTVIWAARDITARKQAEAEIQQTTTLLRLIKDVQSRFITHQDARQVFNDLLAALMSITNSDYGFLNEVSLNEAGEPYNRTLALSNISWDTVTELLDNNLAGAPLLTGQVVIASDSTDDLRSGNRPAEPPAIHNFMGIPLYLGGELLGVVGLANREGGYNETLAAFLEPLAATCASIIHALRDQQRKKQYLEDLKQSEEKFRQLAENIHEVFWVRDVATRQILYISPAYERVWGRTCASLYEHPETFVDCIHPDDAKRVETAVAMRQNGEMFDETYRILRPDGTIRRVRARTFPVRNADGEIYRLAGLAEDITERHQAETALGESERKYRLLFENMTTGFALHEMIYDDQGHPLDYRFLDINPAFEKLTGLLASATVNRTVKEVLPTVESYWIETYDHVVRTGEPQAFQNYIAALNKYYDVWAFRPAPQQFAVIVTDMTERQQAEQQLRYQAKLLDDVTNAIISTDLTFTIQSWNRAAEKMYGWRADEVIGKNLSPIIQSQFDGQSADQVVTQLFADKQWIGEATHTRKDGTTIRVRGSTSFIHDHNGTPIGVISVNHDITAQKQAEAELERHRNHLEDLIKERTIELDQAMRRLEAILNSSSDAIVLLHAEKGIEQTNPAFNRLLNCAADHYLGAPFLSLIHPDDVENVQAMIEAAQSGPDVHQAEIQVLRCDDTVFDAYLGITRIISNKYDLRGLVCTLRDISTRKQAERQLVEERNLFRTLTNSLPDLIYIKDNHSRFILINDAHAQHLGLTPAEVIGKTDFDLYPEPLAQQYYQHEQELLNSGQPLINREETTVTHTGQLKTILTSKTPLLDSEGKLIGLVGAGHDITERKRMEEELYQALEKEKELHALKTRFIAMVSHEFRTPLATIQSSTDILKRYHNRMAEDRKQEHLDRVQTEIRRLTDLLDDILMLNRAQTRGLEFNPVSLDLELFCQDIVAIIQQIAETHTIQFTSDCHYTFVLIDAKLMRQALTNLLSNAVKYSPPGSTIYFNLKSTERQIIMQVQDTGIGIPEDDQKHLFENFYRASNVGSISGSGIGLTIVKHAIEAHGGSITYESLVGTGSTFTLTLPV